MKSLFTSVLILFAAFGASAQPALTPGNNVVEKKWIKNTNYQMVWYAIAPTGKIEIGKISTSIQTDRSKITVITNVEMKRATSPWIDSTIANAADLSPVYHSSDNAQRKMALTFGKIVQGFYNDKTKNINTIVNDTVSQAYFDSNLYPALITWLPLKEGYKINISIYDYNPAGKKGVLKATIHDVKKDTLATTKSGTRDVWIITVSDELGGGPAGTSTYYVDVADRRLWKQRIEAGGRTMEMELVE